MIFLPIVDRELRLAARRHTTYRTRSLVALTTMFLGVVIYLVNRPWGTTPEQVSQYIFKGVAGLALLYSLLSGRIFTADCISGEKREGTLGLLFLTDLKGYDVVLGILAATSLNGFYGLLAIFPVLAIPLLVGGVTNGEFWRMVLVLLNTFLLSLAAGIFVSTLSRDGRRAGAGTFCLLLILAAGPPALAGAAVYFSAWLPLHGALPELYYSCPVFALFESFDAGYKVGARHFWWSMAVIHGLTWLLVGSASWVAPRSWQDQPARVRRNRSSRLWQLWTHGNEAKRGAFRRRLLEVNAFYWLAARVRLKPAHVWTFLALMAGWWTWGRLASGPIWLDETTNVVTALMLDCTLKLWIALEAGRQLAEDQKSGAFELLLSTPLEVTQIVRGQWLALRRQFLGSMLVVIGVELVLMMATTRNSTLSNGKVFTFWLSSIVILLADAGALIWVAMAAALTAKTPNHATIKTVSLVLILPWALFGAASAIANAGYLAGWRPDHGWQFYLGCWFAFGMAADLHFGLRPRRQLLGGFRQLALQRFSPDSPRPSLWSRLARRPTGKTPAAFVPISGGRALVRDQPIPAKKWKKKTLIAAGAGAALVAGWLMFASRSPEQPFPPPKLVLLAQSNAPPRIFPGAPAGVFFVLPDGSLWRWGQPGGDQFTRAIEPEMVGTNRDWLAAIASRNHCVGLRSDGTLWEWGLPDAWNPYVLRHRLLVVPTRVDLGNDWVEIAAGETFSVALRRDGTLWAWGDNSTGQFGNGPPGRSRYFRTSAPIPARTVLVQVGKDNDWTAVRCRSGCTLALRRDGTLWVWGRARYFQNGRWRNTSMPYPLRVCHETNWVELTSGAMVLARARSGELWDPLYRQPSGDASVGEVCRLTSTNCRPDHLASAIRGQSELFEVRSNGTLWAKTYPINPGDLTTPPSTSAGAWHQVGKRSDWLSVGGDGGTAFGLTSDGTIWFWGVDWNGKPVIDFSSRLNALYGRFMNWFGKPGVLSGTSSRLPCQKEPRPLLQLVPAPSPPPNGPVVDASN